MAFPLSMPIPRMTTLPPMHRYAWFKEHTPVVPAALEKTGSRHAPPHVSRNGQVAYDAIKKQWSSRLVSMLHSHYPGTKGRVAFADISTPLTLETYLRADKGAGVGLDVTPGRFVASELTQCMHSLTQCMHSPLCACTLFSLCVCALPCVHCRVCAAVCALLCVHYYVCCAGLSRAASSRSST